MFPLFVGRGVKNSKINNYRVYHDMQSLSPPPSPENPVGGFACEHSF